MLATGQNYGISAWGPEYEAELKAQLALTFMESLSPQPYMGIQRPPGLGTYSDALAATSQQGLEGINVDVGKMLGSLERVLAQKTENSFLREDDNRKGLSFSYDFKLGEESKFPASPGSTGSPLSEDMFDGSEEDSLASPSSKSPTTPTTPFSLYSQSFRDQPQVPNEALNALHQLKDLVAEEHLKREDLMTNEVTAQLYPFIPFDDEGNVTSLGSILHAEGICKPCIFWKKDRCHKKDLCLYCHFEHDIPKPACSRKSKSKRMRLARHRGQQQEQFDDVLRMSL